MGFNPFYEKIYMSANAADVIERMLPELESPGFFTSRDNIHLIRKDREKILFRYDAEKSETGCGCLFVKVYRASYSIKRFADIAVNRKGALRDYKICRKLKNIDIPVPCPIAAFKHLNPLKMKGYSVFASQWLPETLPVMEVIKQSAAIKENRSSGSRKLSPVAELLVSNTHAAAEFVSGLGNFIGRLHKNKVYQRDMNCGNILADTAGENPGCFFLVDYERIKAGAIIREKQAVDGLAAVGAMMTRVFDNAGACLARGYAGQRTEFDSHRLAEMVKARAAEMLKEQESRIESNFRLISEKLSGN